MAERRRPGTDDLHPLTLRDGAVMHYLQRGVGRPILLVHGGGRDLRAWLRLAAGLERHWTVIAPSRRYCWPNAGNPRLPHYSPVVDADDLAELLAASTTADAAVVVGSSMGAAAAIHLAIRHPRCVRALSVAEPPIHCWAARTPSGQAQLDHFLTHAWRPAADAFAGGQPERAMRLLIDHFLGDGSFDRLLPAVRHRLLENARDFEAQTRSTDAFPDPGRAEVAALAAPLQMLSGECTLPLHRTVDDMLATVARHPVREVIAGAGHDVWAEAPQRCATALANFLAELDLTPAG